MPRSHIGAMLRAIAGAGLLAALPAGATANDARWPGPSADGAIERVDLSGAVRGRGVYALREWPEARDVLGVRLSARALAGDAAIGFLLVR
jgi:hypothetical protein